MGTKMLITAIAISLLLLSAYASVCAQQLQIPTLQVDNGTKIQGNCRVGLSDNDYFTVEIELKYPQWYGSPVHLIVPPRPVGSVQIRVDMPNREIGGTFVGRTIELVSSIQAIGDLDKLPPSRETAFVRGRCSLYGEDYERFRFWMMIAKNEDKPDIIGFAVVDEEIGNTVAYGTGPVVEGEIKINEQQ